MSARELVMLLGGRPIGTLERSRNARLRFVYAEDWRASPHAFPLSLSMPLAAAEHKHAPIEAFLWGLLPDNEAVLDRWAKRFQVSARNVFGLIANVGEDCAGAVQFVPPERQAALLDSQPAAIEWLDEAAIAERLRALRHDHAAWRAPQDTGQFSLAGAQPKTALLLHRGRWGVPSGRTPTTHILKPPTGDFDGHAENEHFCLLLARRLGLPAVSSEVHRFDGEVAIVVERYDRVAAPGRTSRRAAPSVLRVHQEDMCQALGLPPTAKYQSEGGPKAADIVELLRTHSSRAPEDVRTFVDALTLNWLIAGTDAHAKNYSLLHGEGGRVRLAPFYDIASALPYPALNTRRIKLAMKLGGEYRLQDIGARHFRKLAAELHLPADQTLARAAELAAAMPQASAEVAEQLHRDHLHHPLITRLRDALQTRAKHCLAALR